MVNVIDVPVVDILETKVTREHRARRSQLYTIHDTATNSAIITQKLTDAAAHLNLQYATNRFEVVSARGLYRAANNHAGYTGGLHKMRYRVWKCDLSQANAALEYIRSISVSKAELLTTVAC